MNPHRPLQVMGVSRNGLGAYFRILLLGLMFQGILPVAWADAGNICGRSVESLVPAPGSILLWLPGGVKSLPDLRLLREGDGLVVKAHTADEALSKIHTLKQRIRKVGGDPFLYRYIIRTFPANLVTAPSGSEEGVPFFASVSTKEMEELKSQVFAIMFDHERIWYDRAPSRLPPWSWEYDWTTKQVKSHAAVITAQCIPAGVLVTPSSRKEGKWIDKDGKLKKNGFAQLLNTQLTGLNYLIVQAQPRCREDDSGFEYGAFAKRLNAELTATFPGEAAQKENLVMQVSIDNRMHEKKGANYVPPDWAYACLAAATAGVQAGAMNEPGNAAINGFFIWSGSRRATCETLKMLRKLPDVNCKQN